MASRMRRPETVRLEISQGDWLLVKKHLTAGEQRKIFSRVMKPMRAGDQQPEVDPMQAGSSMAIAYLVDWSITDLEGKTIAIEGQPADVVASALDNLDYDSFKEISNAVEAHDAAMTALREQEKNSQGRGSAPSAISTSAV